MTHTIRAMVMGGLGNQMFIYAAARALAIRTVGRLVLDVSRFASDHDYKRVFLLDRFPIQAEVISPGLVGRAASRAVAVGIRFYREVLGTVVDVEAVISPYRRVLVEHSLRHPGKQVTYLHRPARPCEDYVPSGWKVIECP